VDTPSVKGLRIAYSPDLGAPPIEPDVRDIVRDAVAAFDTDLSAHVEQVVVDLPDAIDYFIDWWGPQILMELDDLRAEGIDLAPLAHVESALSSARAMTAVDYARVMFRQRERIHRVFAEIFVNYELLAWPTTPMTAYPHPGEAGGPTTVAGQEARAPELQNQRYTEAISHAGYPAITVPAGWTADGLPVGLQIASRHGADALVLIAAAALEEARPWCHRRPAI
jgi:Asp-tRNA(Asn)/Glu-tRNA(Gln) amidotransferase A subunit family amidase